MLAHAPYPGLRPFRRDEAEIFFGRDEHIDALLETMRQERRLVAVVGDSGGGKSSLVKAGLLPALEAGFLVGAGSRWRVVEMQPGSWPLSRLAAALQQALEPGAPTSEDAVGLLASRLRGGPLGLAEAMREREWPPATNLVLLVDQFEELIRFQDETASDEADAFVSLLLATAREPALPVYIVLTMRSDYLGRCSQFQGLPEALNHNQYLTPRLSRDQLTEAIVGPARMFGGDVEPTLVNTLLNEVNRDQDQLPVLQHALMRMWACAAPGREPTAGRTLTFKLYDEIGRMREALPRHATEAYNKLAEKQQDIAVVLFRTLSQGGPTGGSRHPSQLKVIASHAGASLQETYDVAKVFEKPEYGFVTISRGFAASPGGDVADGETILDLSHESLIRLWPSLRARLGRMGQRRLWAEQDVVTWMQNKALGFCRSRAIEWHGARSPEEMFQFYCEKVPAETQRRESVSDWHQAEVYFAAEVIDGRFALGENLGPDSFSRLERVWLREVKALKAYFRWKPTGGWGVALTQGHYLAACKELIDLLRDGSRKAGPMAFAPIRRYIADGFVGTGGRSEAREKRRVRVDRLVAMGVTERESSERVDKHLRGFYENITLAASESPDETATSAVLAALGLRGGSDLDEAIVDCFEMAIAIQFLDAELAGRILDHPEQARNSA